MFHVRHLITQTNLGILKRSQQRLLTTKSPSDDIYNTVGEPGKALFGFEQIIRIDHTETEQQRRITLSQSCIKRLQELGDLKKYLKISVDSGGCSGFEYKFSLSELTDEDKVIEQDNCKVLVDKETEDFIKGSTIDYHEELIKSGFRIINNPNSEQACSCGSSFSPKI